MTDTPRPPEPPPEAEPARPVAEGDSPGREPVEGPAAPAAGPIEDELARSREDAQKYLGNWQRAEADFQNYKRRVEQERDETRRFASAALIINSLPILDDLERALMSVDTQLAGLTWFDGIRLIHRKLMLVLENSGVSVIEAEGQQFDPRYHEAVAHHDGEEGKVLAEVQRGYKLFDRVLRPAMVVVGRGKEHGTGNTEQTEGEAKEGEPS